MFKEKIEKLISSVKKAKDVFVHSAAIYPPMSKDKLDRICAEFDIPAELLSFYSEMNGCQLSYTFKANKDFNKEKFGYYDEAFPAMWPNENYWSLDGCINIPPLDFIFRNSWKDYIWFDSLAEDKITYRNQLISRLDFEKRIYPLDVFSKNSIAVIYPAGETVDVLLSTDHNSSYTDFLPLTFRAYMTGIIKTRGIIDKRKDIFKSGNQNNIS